MRRHFAPFIIEHHITSLLTILLGVLLLMRPRFIIGTGARFLGIMLIVVGVASFINRNGNSQSRDYSSCTSGFAFCLAGLVILTKYRSMLSIFPTVAGLLMVISGLINLSRSYDLGRAGERKWLVLAFGSLVGICFGILILIHPLKTIYWIARFTGVVFICSGLVDLFIRKMI